MLFQSPSPTQYDLHFSLFGIPVRVHPMFWLITLMFGLVGGSLFLVPIWVFVIFISILIHEMGHALAFRLYGVRSHVVLHAMGGLAIPEAAIGWANSPSPRQQIVISLAGPFAGFLFAGIIIIGVVFTGGSVSTFNLLGFIPLPLSSFVPYGGRLVGELVHQFLWVNIFWGLINLLPVFPLDGGQVARNVLVQYDPWDGTRKSLWVSTVTGGIVAVIALLLLQSVYMALLFGLLAFQSYQALSIRY